MIYAAKLHSSRLQGPTERDLRSLLRYIKGTTHYKLFIGRGLQDYLPTTHNGFVMFPQNNIPLDLHCYTDSDWAGDKTTRRSTSGWLCSLLGTPLSYASRTQAAVTLSRLGVNKRSHHITQRYLWIPDLRQAGEVDIKSVTTHENPADIYTKLLPAATLRKHLPQSGLLSLFIAPTSQFRRVQAPTPITCL